MTNQINEILNSYAYGLYTQAEAVFELESLAVRGSFTKTGFIGYDYRNQTWINFPFK